MKHVTFEQANELEKLGFAQIDHEDSYYYTKDDGILFDWNDIEIMTYKYLNKVCAPSLDNVVRWFRNKKNIDILPYRIPLIDYYNINYNLLVIDSEGNCISDTSIEFKTYNEALFSGINTTINNLKTKQL